MANCSSWVPSRKRFTKGRVAAMVGLNGSSPPDETTLKQQQQQKQHHYTSRPASRKSMRFHSTTARRQTGLETKTRRKRKRVEPPPSTFKYPFLVRTIGRPITTTTDVGVGEDDPERIIGLELVYLDDAGIPRFRVERRSCRLCPFCSFHVKSVDKLIKHVHRFHGDHHNIDVFVAEDGMTTLSARPSLAYREQARMEAERMAGSAATAAAAATTRMGVNHMRDFAFVRYRPNISTSTSTSTNSNRKRKRKRKRRTPTSRQRMLHWPPTTAGWNKEDPSIIIGDGQNVDVEDTWTVRAACASDYQAIRGAARINPRRQYYHSRTRIPMRMGDWNVDSDDESDQEWANELGTAGLTEFVDVNPTEKRVLQLWNIFIRSDIMVPDKDVTQKVLLFLTSHAQDLRHLRQEVLMMLTNFMEHRLLPPHQLLTCMKEFDDIQSGDAKATTFTKAKGEETAELVSGASPISNKECERRPQIG